MSQKKSLSDRLLYRARDFRSRQLFRALHVHCGDDVLDIGGWDFVTTASRRGIDFKHWTTIERYFEHLPPRTDPRVRIVCGDAGSLPFPDSSQRTVLCIQVLEHLFEPIRAVEEIGRVLAPGGKAIIMVPGTGTMHLAPHFHQNVSRYWLREALKRGGMEEVSFVALGGAWSTIASRLVYFFLQTFRYEGMSDPAIRRSLAFWALLPLQMLFAVVAIPICLVFSLGDLEEEPNNYLLVATKAP